MFSQNGWHDNSEMELARGVFPTAPLNPWTEECVVKPLPHEIFRKAEAMVKAEVETGLPYDMGGGTMAGKYITQEHDITKLRKADSRKHPFD